MSFLSKLFGTKSHSGKEAANAAEGGHSPIQAQPPAPVRTKDRTPTQKMALSAQDRQTWKEAIAGHLFPPAGKGFAAPGPYSFSKPFAEARLYLHSEGRIWLVKQAVDLDTGTIVAITTQGGAVGDTTSVRETLPAAGYAVAEQIATTTARGSGPSARTRNERSSHGQGLSQRRELGGHA